jgi:isoaspartyl peptidase/L-asparaginase-like protein (Ntn-hydrolase superfamily)
LTAPLTDPYPPAGRVGDSPVIGAGTYADDSTVAVSATGEGEYFLRAVLAYDIAARVAYGGRRLRDAASKSLHERLRINPLLRHLVGFGPTKVDQV